MSDDDHTLYCGNLSNRITEELLYELFLQAGPLKKISLPKDASGYPRPYAFITFKHESSVSYAAALFNQTKLFDRFLTLKHRQRSGGLSLPIEDRPKVKEPTSWAELNALKGSNDMHYNDILPNGLGLALEPDFNMLLQMGNQMMFPPSLPIQAVTFPQLLGGPIGYPSQMEDMYGSRHRDIQEYGHGHSYNRNHPYEQDRHRDHSHKESSHRDHGRSHHRNWDSSSSHRHRERRDRRH